MIAATGVPELDGDGAGNGDSLTGVLDIAGAIVRAAGTQAQDHNYQQHSGCQLLHVKHHVDFLLNIFSLLRELLIH
jgi:hypothetical protein